MLPLQTMKKMQQMFEEVLKVKRAKLFIVDSKNARLWALAQALDSQYQPTVVRKTFPTNLGLCGQSILRRRDMDSEPRYQYQYKHQYQYLYQYGRSTSPLPSARPSPPTSASAVSRSSSLLFDA
jgi:hypothetical protein